MIRFRLFFDQTATIPRFISFFVLPVLDLFDAATVYGVVWWMCSNVCYGACCSMCSLGNDHLLVGTSGGFLLKVVWSSGHQVVASVALASIPTASPSTVVPRANSVVHPVVRRPSHSSILSSTPSVWPIGLATEQQRSTTREKESASDPAVANSVVTVVDSSVFATQMCLCQAMSLVSLVLSDGRVAVIILDLSSTTVVSSIIIADTLLSVV